MLHDGQRLAMAVFTSYKTSFKTWRRAGLLGRELGYLRLLSDEPGTLALVTYDSADRDDAEAAPPGPVTGRPRWLPAALYSVLAPFLHWRLLRRASVVRASQLRGAWTAAIASVLHRKPLVLRTGYVWSQFNRADGGSGIRYRTVLWLERFGVRRADLVITASEADRDTLVELHGVAPEKVHVIPNPVDTDLFRPAAGATPRKGLVTYAGRLEAQKGLDILIDAIAQVPGAKLRVIGDGSLRAELERRSARLPVEFTGAVVNEQLPGLLAETDVFVLPSRYEGTPKSLLEAMACGCGVITTRVPGTVGVVTDGETGLVVEPDPSALAAGIRKLLADGPGRNRLGTAAREYVVTRHSMVNNARREAALIRSVVRGAEGKAVRGQVEEMQEEELERAA